MSEAIKALFSDISPTYDKLNHILSLNIDKYWRNRAISLISQPKNREIKCLDVCAGTFDLSLACLKRFPKSQLTAVDFSEGMLRAGIPKIAPYLAQNRITTLCADALAIPLPDKQFDVAFCAYGIRNLDDTRRGLLEIKRLLKPNGQIIILEFFKPSDFAGTVFHQTYSKAIIPTLGRFLSGHRVAYDYLKTSIQGFMTREEFAKLLSECGFEQIREMNFFMSISTAFSGIAGKTSS